ncbi:LamG-like jellyroll fold domain-containing protein [Flavobacterium pallidum]|uniref:Ig-like domain-containing protein n=1 Tax=Flavobacterium pallidum TaxID=2172098 RepID=A0A2S1SIM7_9FLAO|nr:LamG-like jellyroll fold domain-containing protein [Flavobacterium pallidum]AWI26209.1 hypothetical protein HYN49_10020 [Flavobacterium pallidum]
MRKIYYSILLVFAVVLQISAQGTGKALDFDGNDDYVTVGAGTPVAGSWTISAWVQPKDATKNMHIFDSRSPSEYGFDMQILNGNTIHCDIGNGTSWKTTTANATYNYTPGVWFHVALSVDYYGYYIYVNGKIIASGPLDYVEDNILIDNNHQLQIGRNPNFNTYFRGAIDEVRVNITSGHPTEAQMTAEMNSPVYTIPSGIISYSFTNAATTANGNNPGQTTVVNSVNGTRYGTMQNFYLQSAIGNWTTDRDYYSVLVNGTTYYQSLAAAFSAINNGVHTGAISVKIIRDSVEPQTPILDASGTGAASYSSINISPVGGVERTITVSGNEGIFIRNAQNVTIDGLNTDGNALTIRNITPGFQTITTFGSTGNNVITRCKLLGSGASGVVSYTTHTVGNSQGNTLSYCTIGPYDSSLPQYGVYLYGDPNPISYSNISNNTIYDYTLSGVYARSKVINITVANNKLFQTVSRAITSDHSAIHLGNSYGANTESVISGNTIGYANSNGTGTYTLTGSGKFTAIDCSFGDSGMGTLEGGMTRIENNTIAGIAMSGTSAANAFNAIHMHHGQCNITGNTIGSLSANGNINYNSTTTAEVNIYGIYKSGIGTFVINSNNIGGITMASSGIVKMKAIGMTGLPQVDGAIHTCNNNIIGGTVANSILNNATASGSDCVGVYAERESTISGNTIRNLTGYSPDINGKVNGVYSFMTFSTNYSPFFYINTNTIYNISNLNASTTGYVVGIENYGYGSVPTTEINRNQIYSIIGNSPTGFISGIKILGKGNFDFKNNMIALGSGISVGATIEGICSPGLNSPNSDITAFNNSIYIGGTQTSGAGNSKAYSVSNARARIYYNNIFANFRSNSGGTGTHCSMDTYTQVNYLAMNNNLYFGNGNGYVMAYVNGLSYPSTNMSGYRNALGAPQETSTIFSNPQFIDATAATPNLHISPTIPTRIESTGGDNTGYPADDFDGETRSSLTPIDIGADAGNFTVFAAPSITSLSSASGCVGTSLTINGNNFYQVTAVRIGSTNCTITANTSNSVTVTIPAVASGTSGVVTIDAFTGSVTGGSTFTIYSAPVITQQPQDPPTICSTAGTALISVSATGATTYQWRRNGINLTNTPPFSNVTTATLTITDPTTAQNGSGFDVLINNPGNCGTVLSTMATLTVVPRPTIGISGLTTVCNGGSTTLTATGATSYSWSPSTGLNTSTGSTVIATPSATTTYTVTGINSSNCSNSQTVTVTVNSLPTADITPSAATICVGSGVTLTASGGTSYSWSPSTGLNTTNGAVVTATPSSTITYTVSVTNANGCISTKTVTVTVNTTLPTVDVTPSAPTICTGNSTTLTATGATTYSWAPATGLSATTGATVIASPASTTTYTITGTTNGCSSTKQVTVSVNVKPSVNITPASVTICSGSGTTLTATGASTYAWSPSTGLSATTGATVTATPTTTTTYTVTGTGSNGCTNTQTVVVTVNTTPSVNVTPASPSVCTGGSVALNATGANSYTWSPATGLNTTTGASVTANPTVTTTYTITGTTNGCSSTRQVTVTVGSQNIDVIAASPNICPGSGTTLTASGATTYTWSPATGLSATTGASVTATPTVTTTYTVVGTTGSCTGSNTITVTVKALPTISVTPSSATICVGSSTSLTANGADTYTWTPSSGLNATTGATVTASPATTTTYTVTGTGTNGCTASQTVTITVTPHTLTTISPAAVTKCQADPAVPIAVTDVEANVTTLSENFDLGVGTWTVSNAGSSPATGNWKSVNSSFGTVKLMQAQGVISSNAVDTKLTSPSFSTMGYEGASLSFKQYYANSIRIAATVQISVDGGTNWQQLADYTFSTYTSLTTMTLDLGNYLNYPNVKIRFFYSAQGATNGWYIDDVKITTVQPTTTWTPVTGLFSNAAGTIPYAGENRLKVYAKPSNTTTYSATTIPASGCPNEVRNATVTVNPMPVIGVSPAATICEGSSTILIANGASGYTWSPSTGLNTTTGGTVIANPSVTTTYTVTGTTNGCSATNTVTVSVIANTHPVINVPNATKCSAEPAILLSVNDPGVDVTVLSENFDTEAPDWLISGEPYSAVEAAWQYEDSFVPGNGKLVRTHPGDVSPSAFVYTWLKSPSFSTVGHSDYKLTFEQKYNNSPNESAIRVEISTDNEASWTLLNDYLYDPNVGSGTMLPYTIDLSAYAGMPDVRIRFYTQGVGAGESWYIDNVKIIANQSQTTWSPSAGLFSDAAATVPYAGEPLSTVYAQPVATTTFTATTPAPSGCQDTQNTAAITVNQSAVITISGNTAVCNGISTALHANSSVTAVIDWSPTDGLDTTSGPDVIATPAITTTYTVTATTPDGCTSTKDITVFVAANYPATVESASTVTKCSVEAAIPFKVTNYLISEDFEDNATDWDYNAWSVVPGPYANQAQTPVFTGTDSILTSPEFSTVGFTSCALDFYANYVNYADYFVGVEITTDNGITWNEVANYTNSGFQGTKHIDLNAYLNQPALKVRFHYAVAFGIVWEIDNITISGSANTSVWLPATGLFTDPAATTPYTGGTVDVVYANPSSDVNYTVTTTSAGGCDSTNTIAVNVLPSPLLNITGATDTCTGTGTLLTVSGADTYLWSPSTGLNTDSGDAVIADPSTTTTYTVTGTTAGCTATQTITVTPHAPIAATVAFNSVAKCASTGAVMLMVNDAEPPVVLINEGFDTNAPGWTVITAPTAGPGWEFADNWPSRQARAQRGPGGMDSQLISPAFSTVGLTTLKLDFDFDYFAGSGNFNTAAVEVSGDNGTTWDQLVNYEGQFLSYAHTTFDLQAYVNLPSIMIRFNYVSNSTQLWRLDNVVVSSKIAHSSWSPVTGLYIDADATIPYNGELMDTVYADPSETTVYTATTTAPFGCNTINTITVNVGEAPVVTVSNDQAICESGAGVTLTASGATNYVWSPATGLNTTNGNTVVASPAVTTTYTVSGDDGGCTDSKTVTVTVYNNQLAITPASAAINSGDAVSLTATGADTYSWSPATGLDTTMGDTVIASPNQTTTYTVTGTTNTGCTFTKSVTVTISIVNFTDNSLHFDGTDDYVNMPNPSVTVRGNFTIEGWFKPEEATKRMHIFSTRGGGDQSFDLQILDGHTFHADFGTGNYWNNTAADVDFGYAPDTWMHIACTFDFDKYLLYVNGNLVGQIYHFDNILLLDGNHFLSLGNSQTEDTFFKGNIDDVRIYDYTRSGSDIQSDMNGAAPGSGIVAHYDFNVGTPGGNNTGLTALPASIGGTVFDGTLHNFSLIGNTSNWVIGQSLPGYCNNVTVWNGTAWSNGVPDMNTAAVISGNYSSTANLDACTLIVGNHAQVIVNDGNDFNIQGKVTVSPGANITINNDANLLQVLDVANSGTLELKKNAAMVRQDYVYWSAPVAGQNLLDFSGETLPNRFYTLDEAANNFAWINPAINDFQPAKGFMIRAANNFINPPAAPQPFIGTFTGVANNGNFDVPVTVDGLGYNLIGNPYPSTLSADLFLAQNPGTLYFWTHRAQGSASGANYCSYNALGGTAAITGGDQPDGFIASGQGFILQAATAATAHFDNSMRSGNDAAFYRSSTEKHRIWLDLNSPVSGLNQILIGYMEGATVGEDIAIDGRQIESGSAISSLINGQSYLIQGRPLPFVNTDVVPLNFNAAAAGTYTIAIDHVDGLFSGNQEIYLKDNLSGTIQSIKNTGYTFVSAEGVFANRFEIVYTNSTLGTENPVIDGNSVIVYKQNGILKIDSGKMTMQTVRIFDIRGRLIYTADDVDASKISLDDLKAEQQVLLLQITSDNQQVVTKKAVY